MATQKNNIPAALHRILAAFAELSEDDLDKLLDDGYTIKIKVVRVRSKEDSATSQADVDIPAIIAKLTDFTSREDAQRFLDENFGGRKLLEPIARKLDVPIMSQDKVDVLRDKIIEATVGARMRSQAIQGGRS